jgi:hypothetical protein
MAAGVTDRLWEVSDLVALLEADERGLERAATRAFASLLQCKLESLIVFGTSLNYSLTWARILPLEFG